MATSSLPHTDLLNNPIFAVQVQKAATLAQTCLPSDGGRISRAVELVLAGAVEAAGCGRWDVASQSAFPETWYRVYNGGCNCPDYVNHAHLIPEFMCKHKISVSLYQKAIQEMEKEEILSSTENTCGVALDSDGVPCYAVHATCPGHSIVLLPPQETPAETDTDDDQDDEPARNEPCQATFNVMIHDHPIEIVLTDSDDFRLLCRIETLLDYIHRDPSADTEDVETVN